MRIEKPNWDRRRVEERSEIDGSLGSVAATATVGIFGFIIAISVYGLAAWFVVWALSEQGAIDWHLEVWQAYVMAGIYFVGRSFNRVIYPRKK